MDFETMPSEFLAAIPEPRNEKIGLLFFNKFDENEVDRVLSYQIQIAPHKAKNIFGGEFTQEDTDQEPQEEHTLWAPAYAKEDLYNIFEGHPYHSYKELIFYPSTDVVISQAITVFYYDNHKKELWVCVTCYECNQQKGNKILWEGYMPYFTWVSYYNKHSQSNDFLNAPDILLSKVWKEWDHEQHGFPSWQQFTVALLKQTQKPISLFQAHRFWNDKLIENI